MFKRGSADSIEKVKMAFCYKLENEKDVQQLCQGLGTITSYIAKPRGNSNDSEA